MAATDMDQQSLIDLKESAANVTMHGFSRLLITKSKTIRFIWLALLLLFTALLVLSVTPTIRRYISSPSLTKEETVLASKIRLPAVTICGPSLYKSKVKQFAKEQNMSLIIGEDGDVKNIVDIMRAAPDLGQLAPDMNKFIISPGSDVQRIFVVPRGFCYKVNSNGTYFQEQGGPDYSLSIAVILNVSDAISLSKDTGDSVEVIIQDHKQFPTLDTGTVLAPVGHLTQIEIQKTEIRRLKPPYPSKCRNEADTKLLFEGEYTVTNCELSCFLMRVIEKCKHISVVYNYLLPTEMKLLNAKNYNESVCWWNILRQLLETKYASCNCALPCKEEKFHKFSSHSKWPSTEKFDLHRNTAKRLLSIDNNQLAENVVRNNLISINVYFGNMEYERITEAPMYTPDKFIAEIGGQMGIWIGASIFSLLELIYLFAQYMGACFRKRKKRAVDPEQCPGNE